MTRTPSRRRSGFTAIEMMVATLLVVLLGAILSATWVGICKPAIDASSRCRIALEASLAAAALARDLGGSLANPEGQLGTTTDGVFVGRMEPSSSWLRLCFHGGTDPSLSPKWDAPDTVISYQFQAPYLVRWDENGGTVVTIARDLTAFAVTPLDDQSGVTISMTFSYRNVTMIYTLVALDPPQS